MLRSMRYGEADRILHLYTPQRGRVGAIAKGVRRARSRFGGRLEPFFRLQLDLHEGRGELLTVTGAQTVEALSAPARGRPRARRRRARVRRGRAAVRDRRAPSGRVQPALPPPVAAGRGASRGPASGARGRARVPAEADARRGSRAAARRLRDLRRARAPRRLLRRRRRSRVRRLRGRSFPLEPHAYGFMTGRSGRRWPRRRRRPSRRSGRSSARSPRRSSTTRTCA